jgi:hypothetical protein
MERTAAIGDEHGSGKFTGFNDTPITCSFNYMMPDPRLPAPRAPGRAGSRC